MPPDVLCGLRGTAGYLHCPRSREHQCHARRAIPLFGATAAREENPVATLSSILAGHSRPSALRPIFIFSPGRAGSTLLSAMFKAIGKPTASEPDTLTQVAMLAPAALARSSNLDMQIVTACVSNLSDYLGPEPIIKLRSQCNAAPERIIGSVENARAIFLLRDRKPWAQSRHRAFREPPRRIARILAETMVAIDRLQQIGAAPQVIWYDDLVAHPWATLAKIMMGSPLKPGELDERLDRGTRGRLRRQARNWRKPMLPKTAAMRASWVNSRQSGRRRNRARSWIGSGCPYDPLRSSSRRSMVPFADSAGIRPIDMVRAAAATGSEF